MQYPMVRSFLAPLAAAALLSACGGGITIIDDGDFENPFSSGRTGSMAVSSPQDTRFSGVYASDDVLLTEVVRVPAAGDRPEVCAFRFADLRLGNFAVLDGTIRYKPDSTEVVSSFIAINGLQYRLDNSAAVTVRHDTLRIRFDSATLAVPASPTETITVTGFVPIRAQNLPAGC